MITSFQDLLLALASLLDMLIPITIAVALLVFFWGLASFIRAGGDMKAMAAGKSLMTWGLVALFVMVSIWGIVGFFQESFFGRRLNIGGSGGGGGSTGGGYYITGEPCEYYDLGTPSCDFDEDGNLDPTRSTPF